jgi:DNA-binding response OmpR family regulator
MTNRYYVVGEFDVAVKRGRINGAHLMTTARPILIVESDPAQQKILREGLSIDDEFEVRVAETLGDADALVAAEDARFDAVVLGLEMPGGDRQGYCAKLRRLGHNMPIIILAGLCDEVDIVRGLNAGASDYLTKPIRLNELHARLRAHLRSFDNSEAAVFTIGRFTFRPSAKVMQDPISNRRYQLTDKETAVLKFLYRAGANSVTRRVLLEKVWGYSSEVETHTLETHIYRLRRKLANAADGPLVITEAGGYRLDAAVAAKHGRRNCNEQATSPTARRPAISAGEQAPAGP